jgi:hypothetical protein
MTIMNPLFADIKTTLTTIAGHIKSLYARHTPLLALANSTDRSAEIQALIDAGKPVWLGAGTFWLGSTLKIRNGTSLRGLGKGTTVLRALPTLVGNVVETATLGVTDVYDFTVVELTIDGNYLSGDWSASTSTIVRSQGNCIEIQGAGYEVVIECYNAPESFAITRDLMQSVPKSQDTFYILDINARVCGKEGIVMYGTNDGSLPNAFIGLFGLLPYSQASTNFALSTRYSGEPVDGIVLDGVNVEVGRVHAYAGWSGVGLRTRGNCRLAANHIISESNNGQIVLSSGTYGGGIAMTDIRNMGMLHPNWTAAIPVYSGPSERWDGITCYASKYNLGNVLVNRTVPSSTKRVLGVLGVNIVGDYVRAAITLSNSLGDASGGAESGVYKSGGLLLLQGKYSSGISVASQNCRGTLVEFSAASRSNVVTVASNGTEGRGVILRGNSNRVTGSIYGNIGSTNAALYRDGGATNNYRNNAAELTLHNCELNFESFGTPTSERIHLTIEARSTDILMTGTAIDRSRAQDWRWTVVQNNLPLSNIGRVLTTTYDETITTEQTIVVPHLWPYTPSLAQFNPSISDTATISNAVVQYVRPNSVDATNVTLKIKLSAAASNGAAANSLLNISVSA